MAQSSARYNMDSQTNDGAAAAHSQSHSPRSPLVFSLTSQSRSSPARSGKLSFTHPAHEDGSVAQPVELETPAIIAYTRKGAPVHLTPDNLGRLPVEMAYMAIEHFLDYNPPAYTEAPYSLARYLGLRCSKQSHNGESAHLLFAGLRDPSDTLPIIANTDLYVACRGFRGVIKMTLEHFNTIALLRAPDIMISLADDPTVLTRSQKRLTKSLIRSEKMLVKTVQAAEKSGTCLFAPLVGGLSLAARSEYMKSLHLPSGDLGGRRPVDMLAGYSINLTTLRDPEDMATRFRGDDDAIACINVSVNSVPSNKPRLLFCPRGPHEVLRLVRQTGCDLFMDQYTAYLSTLGIGLSFSFPVLASSDVPQVDWAINLFDDQHATDFSPLATSAEHAHLTSLFGEEALGDAPTRAYVHHLLHTHEMTAHVLLAMHNTCVMAAFMKAIRRCIQEGTLDAEADRFEAAYRSDLECLSQAQKSWDEVHQQRGKGRLKGMGQDRRTDVVDVVESGVQDEVKVEIESMAPSDSPKVSESV